MTAWKQKLAEILKKAGTASARRGKGPVVGFDGGHQSIKVVKVRGPGTPYAIEDAFVETRTPASETRLAELFKERGYLALPAAFSLADENVETHGFHLPKLKPDELDTAINWEIKKTIASPDFVYHDTLKFERPAGVDVECVVAAKDVVDTVYQSAKKVGVTPQYLETESSAILSCVRAIKGQGPDRMAAIDLGYSSFRLVFFHGNRVSLTRSLYFGLGSLAGEGKTVTGDERPVLEGLYNLCEEVRRSEYFAKDKKGLEEIEEIVLCGGGAVLAPVKDYLQKHLGDKKISVLNPFEGAGPLPPTLNRDLGPLWAVAVGLALREAA